MLNLRSMGWPKAWPHRVPCAASDPCETATCPCHGQEDDISKHGSFGKPIDAAILSMPLVGCGRERERWRGRPRGRLRALDNAEDGPQSGKGACRAQRPRATSTWLHKPYQSACTCSPTLNTRTIDAPSYMDRIGCDILAMLRCTRGGAPSHRACPLSPNFAQGDKSPEQFPAKGSSSPEQPPKPPECMSRAWLHLRARLVRSRLRNTATGKSKAHEAGPSNMPNAVCARPARAASDARSWERKGRPRLAIRSPKGEHAGARAASILDTRPTRSRAQRHIFHHVSHDKSYQTQNIQRRCMSCVSRGTAAWPERAGVAPPRCVKAHRVPVASTSRPLQRARVGALFSATSTNFLGVEPPGLTLLWVHLGGPL